MVTSIWMSTGKQTTVLEPQRRKADTEGALALKLTS